MLATVLRTENASVVSVNIMRAFVAMKKIIVDNYAGKKILYYLNEGGIRCQKL